MRVLVTGASGLLGTWLRRTAPGDVDVIAVQYRSPVARSDVVVADLVDGQQATDAIISAEPDVVVHGAYRRDRASIVDATRHVVTAAGAAHATTIVVSTEAVFSGDGRPRAEDEIPDPVWDYGRWKAEAETIATTTDPKVAIVRPPLLVSMDPADGAARRLRRAATRQEPTTWYLGERRQPAHAAEVAAALWRLTHLAPEEARGCWHLPGPERLSRRELASRVAAALGLPDIGVEEPGPPPSERPRDLHLTGQRAHQALGWDPTPVVAPSLAGGRPTR